jgi:myo-inositol-1(or 4)-monophosphatase
LPAGDLPIDRRREARRLAAAVREAGQLAHASFGKPVKQWTKNESSPVCETDIAVDRLLRQRLAGETPGFGWLSEESHDDPVRTGRSHVWIVDPIDGTRAFLAGRTDWAVSAALVENGRPVAAALYAPATEEFFEAVLGGGATLNAASIAASAGRHLDNIRIAGPKRFLDQLADIAPPFVAMPRVHSLALRIARVARGELDVALTSGNSHDWDLAAADLLVHEAGGTMTPLSGKPLAYNQTDPVHGALLAAGRERHEAMIGLVQSRRNAFA